MIMVFHRRTFLAGVAVLALNSLPACGSPGDADNSTAGSSVRSDAPAAAPRESGRSQDFGVVPGLRMGAVTAISSEADLIAVYGSDVVQHADVPVGEGESERGTVLFAGTPQQLEILWHDADRRCPRSAVARGAGSSWATSGGVRIGAELSAVEQENGVPFEFSGFDWDYQGYVRDWQRGALDGMIVRLALPTELDPRVPVDSPARLGGDVMLLSSDPLVRQIRPVVEEIGLSWPRSMVVMCPRMSND